MYDQKGSHEAETRPISSANMRSTHRLTFFSLGNTYPSGRSSAAMQYVYAALANASGGVEV